MLAPLCFPSTCYFSNSLFCTKNFPVLLISLILWLRILTTSWHFWFLTHCKFIYFWYNLLSDIFLEYLLFLTNSFGWSCSIFLEKKELYGHEWMPSHLGYPLFIRTISRCVCPSFPGFSSAKDENLNFWANTARDFCAWCIETVPSQHRTYVYHGCPEQDQIRFGNFTASIWPIELHTNCFAHICESIFLYSLQIFCCL